jgi:hypothetical protein
MECREERKRRLVQAESPNKKIKGRAAVRTEDDPEETPRPHLPDAIVSYEANDYEESGVRIENPLPSDIILGRGKPFQSHHGNQRMLQIVASHKEKYSSEKREKRRAIAEQILDSLLGSGARFLKRVEGETYWEIVGRKIAFEKVSHVLRSKKRGKGTLPEESSRNEAQPELNIIAAAPHAGRLGLPPAAALPTALYPPLVSHPALGLVPTLAPVMYPPRSLLGPPHSLLGHPLLHQNSLGARSIYDEIAVENMVRAQMDHDRVVDSILRRRRLLNDAVYRRSLGL